MKYYCIHKPKNALDKKLWKSIRYFLLYCHLLYRTGMLLIHLTCWFLMCWTNTKRHSLGRRYVTLLFCRCRIWSICEFWMYLLTD